MSEKSIVTDISGKKILFFAPAFFGYENKIVKKMEEMGACVDMYDVRSVTSAKDRALLKISPKIFAKKSLVYYENIIHENRNKDYDYILIVKCDMTPECILKEFRELFPKAKLCLYLWDSIDNIPVFLGVPEFDDLDIPGLAVLIGRIIGNIDLILLFLDRVPFVLERNAVLR